MVEDSPEQEAQTFLLNVVLVEPWNARHGTYSMNSLFL